MAVNQYFGGDNANDELSDEDMEDFPSASRPAPAGDSSSSSGAKATGGSRYLIRSFSFRDVRL